jgi:hypothetical protein
MGSVRISTGWLRALSAGTFSCDAAVVITLAAMFGGLPFSSFGPHPGSESGSRMYPKKLRFAHVSYSQMA